MTTPAMLERLTGQVEEFVAKHDATGRVNLKKYANDFPGFCRDVLHVELWSAQEKMAASVLAHPRTIVVSGHSTGKDFFSAAFALFWVYVKRGQVVVTGPTERQVRGIVFQLIRRLWTSTDKLRGELYTGQLVIDEVPAIVGFTSNESSRLTGWHHERLLVIMSEAQGCAADAWEAMLSCATSPENRVLAYGNPVAPTGPFYQAAHSAQWERLTVSVLEHPNVVSGKMIVPGGPSRDWVEYMRSEYGEGSSIFSSRVLALFPSEAIEGLLRRDWVEAAFQRHESGALNDEAWAFVPRGSRDAANPLSDLQLAKYGWSILLSCDPARYGSDATVTAFVRGPVVEKLVSWRGKSLTESAARLIALREEHWVNRLVAPPKIICDEPGVGSGVIDSLREKGVGVSAYSGGKGSSNPKKWLNKRAEDFWCLRGLLERGKIALPRDAELQEELLAIEWSMTPQGAIVIESKEDLKKKLGRSIDKTDACLMGLMATVGRTGYGPAITQIVYT